MPRRKGSDLDLGRGWVTLCSDMCWEDYHGMWAKRAPKEGEKVWYVIQWTNLIDAMGKRDVEESGLGQYEVQVKRIDLNELSPETLRKALDSAGFFDNEIVFKKPEHEQAVHVECCIQYGLGAPMWEGTKDRGPVSLREDAVRMVKELMEDAEYRESRLVRPVNMIGSSAAEYGRGDLDSALGRIEAKSTRTAAEDLMVRVTRKAPPGVCVLYIDSCPFVFIDPSHYRDDGTCLCSNAAHRKLMIKELGYEEKDFAEIPLVD